MKFYQKTWFVMISLILFFPLGVFLMWKHKKFNKLGRVVFTMFFGLIFVIAVSGILGSEENNQATSTAPIKEDVEANIESDTDEKNPESESEQQKQADSKNTALGNFSERPVMNGSKTERIGTYVHVHSDRSLITEASLIDFVQNDLPRFEDMNWVVIDLNDGYGLHFLPSILSADYGLIEDGSLSKGYESYLIYAEEGSIQKNVYEGASGYKPLL
ncbi:hypothetical protein [Exiguobacterium sp.]|uniref:hypothetical protein n=1 Tax=Exiguobacterium sp. TaxID=44751 RepID=UPI00391A2F57